MRASLRICVATIELLLCADFAGAQPAAEFYKDKQINFVVASSPGGGFDTYTRLIARHLPKHLAGNPAIVVQNMPGAGGVRAANFLYSVAPKDGTTIALFQNTVPLEPLYGDKPALFEPTKFEWLGSPSREFAVFAIWRTAPVDKIQDARTHELVVGAPGSNSSPAFYGRLFEAIFGIKIKILAGYPGASEVLLGMERRENDGNSSAYWSSLNAIRPDWIAEKKLKFLLQYGPHPIAALEDVPFALDLIEDPFKRKLMEVASAPLGLGRPIAAPPGVSRQRVTALRNALAETFDDPDYRSECARLRLDCDEPVGGQTIADGLARAYAASPDVIGELRRIYNAQ